MILTIASIFMAIAVFCWGTEYKLSLYSLSAQQQESKEAKLLSEAERPANPAALALTSPHRGEQAVPTFGAPVATLSQTVAPFGWRIAQLAAIELPPQRSSRARKRSSLRGPPTSTL